MRQCSKYCNALPSHLFSGFFAKSVDVFAGSSWTHGSDIIGAEMGVNRAYSRTIARNYERTAALATRQSWASGNRLVNYRLTCVGLIVFGRGCRH